MHHTGTDIQRLINLLGTLLDEVERGPGESQLAI